MKTSVIGYVLGAAVVLQIIFLLFWAGYHEYLRRTAPTVLLETVTVDPRDLLRGDYMVLRYAIGQFSVPAGEQFSHGDTVWVGLRRQEGGRFYDAVGPFRSEPEPGKFAYTVRGTVDWTRPGDIVHVSYGIEHYYVPEGMGRPESTDISVEAIVSRNHILEIKKVLVDGKPYP